MNIYRRINRRTIKICRIVNICRNEDYDDTKHTAR